MRSALAISFFLCIISPGLNAATYYVNDGSLSGDIYCSAVGNDASGTGSTSAPYKTLSKALSVASNGDVIYIDAGGYGHASNNGTDKGIAISKSVTINGAGTSLTSFDDNHSGTTGHYFALITASATLYNFSIKNYGGDGSNGQAITVSNTGTTPTVNINYIQISGCGGGSGYGSILINASTNVNITGGGSTCNGSSSWTYSGGIDVVGSSVNASISNYSIISNYTARTSPYGAAISITSASSSTIVTVRNSRIEGNNYDVSSGDGGSIYMSSGVLYLYDCIVASSILKTPSSTNAGVGVAVEGGTAKFSRSIFQNNSGSSTYGGAIAATSVSAALTLTIDSCKFTGNSSARGADIYTREVFSRAVTVTSFNSTYSSSGTNIYQSSSGSITLDKCGSPTTSGTVNFTNTTAPTYTANPTVPSYSGSCNTSITILPVELINFSAKCADDAADIEWQTASERNNDFFTVEKSEDGIHFSALANIEAAGNSKAIRNYFYRDEQKGGAAYYRLSQTDTDGKRTFFEAVFVQENCKAGNEWLIYPNPFSDYVHLQFDLRKAGAVYVNVFNCLGELVKSTSLSLERGVNNVDVYVNEFSDGIYFFELIAEGKWMRRKLVKQ